MLVVPSLSYRNSLTQWAGEYAKNATLAIPFLEERGIPESAAVEHQLGVVSGPHHPSHANFQGMLAIPYRTPNGVVGFKFRHLNDDKRPKYLAPTGQQNHLFNVMDFQKQSPFIAIAEGELAALTVSSVAGIPCVGVPGVKGWQPHHKLCFDGYDQVFVIADNDAGKHEDGRNPGKELAERIAEALPNTAVVIELPPGMDADEFILQRGVQSLHSLLFGTTVSSA